MLSAALLNAADRLITTLMTLVDGISPILLTGTPTFPDHAVHALWFRLVKLVHTLIRIDICGIRAPAKPATPNAGNHPAPVAQRSGPAQRLPSHPGWLLAALPDIAPAVASDLAALLADPAFIALLAAAPTLHRTLRPLLRSLGLIQPPSSPDASPPLPRGPPSTLVGLGCSAPHQPSSATASPRPVPVQPCPQSTPPRQIAPIGQTPFHAHIVTTSK